MVWQRTHGTKLLILAFLLVILFFLFPFLSSLSIDSILLSRLKEGNDSLMEPFARGVVFALGTSTLLVTGSLISSLFLSRIGLRTRGGLLLSLLLIPVILGSISTSFIWKLLLFDNLVLFGPRIVKFTTLAIIEFWQYGTFFIYLFWLNQQTLQKRELDYAHISQLSTWEKIRDVLLPRQRNLATLLLVLGYIFCFYEEAKIGFIFRASRGTGMEMANQWLNRTYESDLLVDAAYAVRNVSVAGLLVLFMALVSLIVFLNLFRYLYRLLLAVKLPFVLSRSGKGHSSYAILGVLLIFTVAPVLLGIAKQTINIDLAFKSLLYPFGLCVLAAFLAALFAALFANLCRVTWIRTFASFNTRSMAALILMFLLLMTPPLLSLVCGFKWMGYVGYHSEYNIVGAWVIGHILLSFPLLAGFTLVTNFRVRNEHILYFQTSHLSAVEQYKDLFLYPFRADYLLVFLLGIALVWNESVINNILSDVIPSFVTELNKTISGKGTDYSQGLNYLFISVALALASVSVWTTIMYKNLKNEKDHELSRL